MQVGMSIPLYILLPSALHTKSQGRGCDLGKVSTYKLATTRLRYRAVLLIGPKLHGSRP